MLLSPLQQSNQSQLSLNLTATRLLRRQQTIDRVNVAVSCSIAFLPNTASIMPWLHVKLNYFKIISAYASTSAWNNFISAREKLPEIMSKLFHRLIAAHECFSTCSLLL